jgi:hydroxymethylpyrimidine pyrophosphatase-like HAD family hydrolase
MDFAEDVPLMTDSEIDQIVAAFDDIGATCKVSSIHVNGWFGEFNKLEGCRGLVRDLWGEDLEKDKDKYLYFGDSANDEPMFEFFTKSIGVANVATFLPRLKSPPKLITKGNGGYGFREAIEIVLELRSS